MKKQIILFILFIVSVGFISCSKDNDSATQQDKIVGNWKIIEQTLDGFDFTDECTFEKRYRYFSDGTSQLTDQSYDETLDACIPSLASGTWENMGNNNYHVEVQGTQPADFEVIFSNNGNTVTFSTILTIGEDEAILQAIFQRL